MIRKSRGRNGGRKKGSPNKITSEQRQWINDFLNQQREDFEECWSVTPPDKRVGYYLKMMEFVCPRPQQITLDGEIKQLENLLSTAPQAAIDAIAEKIYQLNQMHNES